MCRAKERQCIKSVHAIDQTHDQTGQIFIILRKIIASSYAFSVVCIIDSMLALIFLVMLSALTECFFDALGYVFSYTRKHTHNFV